MIALLLLLPAGATASQPAPQDLKRLTIEQLMQIDVTLAARRPEPIATAPTAISVVTGDDIRRAGVTTLADAVALADGVHVARFNNGTWSVTARGFAAVAANKMLVMIDGRTVYSPLFTGVFWNALDYELEDIDRIEVIRGPGATLWGRPAERGGAIPAIAVTAYAAASDRASALAAGYEAHVAKPFEPEALAQAVAMLCRAQARPS